MATVRFSACGKTDAGVERSRNEDALLVDVERALFAVADGLGGLPRGDLASQLAIESIRQQGCEGALNTLLDMHQAIRRANTRVYEEGGLINADVGIGTTLTAIRIVEDQLLVGHIGDTALYLSRRGMLKKLTKDHNMAQEVRDSLQPGEEAYIPEYFAHTLTRCLGQTSKVVVDLAEQRLESADRLLLCSDGVDKVFEDPELQVLLAEAHDPKSLVDYLINEGNHRGGPDNITVVVVFVE